MKNTLVTMMTGLALAATAQAGEDYSAKAPPVPVAEPCLWSWFAGGSGGYVDDIDNDMWTLHIGKEYKCPGSNCSHAIFLEVGWTSWDEGDSVYDYGDTSNPYPNYDLDYDFDVIPITLNYKYECQLTNNLNWYIGAGAGIAISEIDVSVSNGNGNFSDDDSETNFYGHIFAGLVYNFTESFEMFGGVRYLYMDGTDDLLGVDVPGVLDDDFFYELGARWNF
ncbi:outer membrane beta-barrel protein [Verrucomicrobiaceae bacterium N1E253]|uniref:Outer membrane beta-barrel protein n=1 Tax=Oceaniferula marina TaxID=2748318 RepID=A0A851GEY3_9BACT|nr:outer membrane beta-barrel protein [Oceaniferula marina]NWK55749.1 outer membrane beta-barrel protein [Oceaniferula marina]